MDDFLGDEAVAFVFANEFVGLAEHGVEGLADCALFHAVVAEGGDSKGSHIDEALASIRGRIRSCIEELAILELLGKSLQS